MKISKGENGDYLVSQRKYIESLLNNFELDNVKGKKQLYPIHSDHRQFTGPYLELIGSLNYISTCTRPDIATMVSMLSRYNTNPTVSSHEA
eukprot:Pgem_evm1s19686